MAEKYLVRVVRPVFQAAYLEVEGRDENEACCIAATEAYQIPEENWRGRFNPEDHGFDAHCVRSGETDEGDEISLLDFPEYSILSTNENPVPVSNGYQPWMNYHHPLTVAGQMSHWIDQLEDTRKGCYEEGIEDLEATWRKLKGADQKVVPLMHPEDQRHSLEFLETILNVVRQLNDVD